MNELIAKRQPTAEEFQQFLAFIDEHTDSDGGVRVCWYDIWQWLVLNGLAEGKKKPCTAYGYDEEADADWKCEGGFYDLTQPDGHGGRMIVDGRTFRCEVCRGTGFVMGDGK